jgi:AraC family transcriptional regulator of adaptative response / DNA-3-methyladenine glycosylase II
VLHGLPGVMPWTVQRIARHVLGDPDAFDPGDPAVHAAIRALPRGNGSPPDPSDLDEHARRWRPWRSYAVMHLCSAVQPSADRRLR